MHPSVDWDDRLTVSLDGQPIHGSNLIDLITHAVSRKRTSSQNAPIGFQPLKNIFKTHNFPTSLVNNRAWIEDQRSDPIWRRRSKGPSRYQGPLYVSDEEEEEGNSYLVSSIVGLLLALL